MDDPHGFYNMSLQPGDSSFNKIKSINDPRLQGIPEDFQHPVYGSFAYAKSVGMWDWMDEYYKEYKRHARSQGIQFPVTQNLNEIGQQQAPQELNPNILFSRLKREQYTDKPFFKKKEEKKPFNPEDYPTMYELFPDYKQAREESLGRIKTATREIKEIIPPLKKLMKQSNKALGYLLQDTVRELEAIFSDKKRIEEAIYEAEGLLEERLKKEQKKRHEATGFWGFLNYALEDFHNEFNPGYSQNFSERDIYTDVKEKAFRDLTARSEKQYIRLENLLGDMEAIGLMDMVDSMKKKGFVLLRGYGEYEDKRLLLYQKMAESFASKDVENRIKLREHVYETQTFLLEDMQFSDQRHEEFEIFFRAMTEVYGEIDDKNENEYFEDYYQRKSQKAKKEAEEHKKTAEVMSSRYKQKWYEKAKNAGKLDLLKSLFVDQEYQGNVKTITNRVMDEYIDAIDDVYNPGIIDRFWAMVKGAGDFLTQLIPEVVPLIPGLGIGAHVLEKVQEVGSIIVETTIGKLIAKSLSRGAAFMVSFTLKYGLMMAVMYYKYSTINMAWLSYAMACHTGLDVMLLNAILTVIGIIPGFNRISRWMKGVVDFSGPGEEHMGILKKDAKGLIANAGKQTGTLLNKARNYMLLKTQVQEIAPYVNMIRSKAYSKQRMNELRINRALANARENEDLDDVGREYARAFNQDTSNYNLGEITTLQEQEGQAPNMAVNFEGVFRVADILTGHVLTINPRIKSPKDAWKKTFVDAKLSDIYRDRTIRNQREKMDIDFENSTLKNLRKEAAKDAEAVVRTEIRTSNNYDGIPTVAYLREKIRGIDKKINKLETKQKAEEEFWRRAKKEKNDAAAKKYADAVATTARHRYSLLYQASYYNEIALNSESNHDEFGRDIQRATLFLRHQSEFNSFFNPDNYRNNLDPLDYEQLKANKILELNGVDPFEGMETDIELVERLHKMDVDHRRKNPDSPGLEFDMPFIARELQDMRDSEAKKAIKHKGDHVSLVNLDQAAASAGYFELHGNPVTSVFSAIFNFGLNMVGWVLKSTIGGVPNTIWQATKAGIGVAFVAATFGANMELLMSPGIRSIVLTNLFSNQVLFPLFEMILGESYTQMSDKNQRIKKAVFDLDDQMVQRREAKRRHFVSQKKRKREGLTKKREKYVSIKERSKRVRDESVVKFSLSGGIDSVKKVQAAENRFISEEIQYQALIDDIDKEIAALDAETFDEYDREDIIPGYDKQMDAYRKELDNTGWKIKTLDHLRSIPTYVNWATMAYTVGSLMYNPESEGTYVDSSGRRIYKFQKQVHQKEMGYEKMDDYLGINQTPSDPSAGIPEELTQKIPEELPGVPPTAMTFKVSKEDTSTVPGAVDLLERKQQDAGVFIDKNYVLFDVVNKKIYENPSTQIRTYLETVEGGLGPGMKTEVDLSQPFSLFPGPNPSSTTTQVRLMPRAIFETVSDPSLALPSLGEETTFYKTFFGGKENYGDGGFDVLVQRFDKTQLKFLVSSPEESMSLITDAVGFTPITEGIDPDQSPAYNYNPTPSSSPPPRFNFYSVDPGEPYTKSELEQMRVSDAFWLMNAIKKKYGTDVLNTPEGIENVKIFLGSNRQHHDLQSFLRRQQVLETVSAYEYGMAWANFAMGWLYAGLEYDKNVTSSTLGLIGTAALNITAYDAPEGVNELLTEIDKLQVILEKMNDFISTDAFKTVAAQNDVKTSLMESQVGGFQKMKPEDRENLNELYTSTRALIQSASAKGYNLYEPDDPNITKLEKSNSRVASGHRRDITVNEIQTLMSVLDDPERIAAVVRNIKKNVLTLESELEEQKYQHNLFMSRKTISALTHEMNEKLWTSAEIYFKNHAKITGYLNPFGKTWELATGQKNEHAKGSAPVTLLTSVGSAVLEQIIYGVSKSVVDFTERSRVTGQDPYDQLLSDVIPLNGTPTDEQMSTHMDYDYKRILDPGYSDKLFDVSYGVAEYIIEQSRAIARLDTEQSNIAYGIGKTAQGVGKAFNVASNVASTTASMATGTYEAIQTIKNSLESMASIGSGLSSMKTNTVESIGNGLSAMKDAVTIESIGNLYSTVASYPASLFSGGGDEPESPVQPIQQQQTPTPKPNPVYVESLFSKLNKDNQQTPTPNQTPLPYSPTITIPPNMTPTPKASIIPKVSNELVEIGDDYDVICDNQNGVDQVIVIEHKKVASGALETIYNYFSPSAFEKSRYNKNKRK
jgi:hypothetical protein